MSESFLKYINVYKWSLILVVLFRITQPPRLTFWVLRFKKATTEIFNCLVAKIKCTGGLILFFIGKIVLIMICLYFISAVFGFIQGWLMTGIAQKVSFRMRKELSAKINRMPMKYFESRTHGEVLSRITNDVDTLGMSFNQAITPMIYNVATIIGVLIMMLSISPLMTIIPFVILPVAGLLMGTVMKKSQKYFKSQQEYLGHINGQVEEVYGGHIVVKAFNREEEILKEFDKNNKVLFKSAWMSQFLSGILQPIMVFIGNLGYVAVAVTGAWLAIKGVIKVGDIQAFYPVCKTVYKSNRSACTGKAVCFSQQ
jgi:ATP-binding cassette subfamily B protein